MAEIRPCSRHALSLWIASCADCTAWHRARIRAARAEPRTTEAPGRAA